MRKSFLFMKLLLFAVFLTSQVHAQLSAYSFTSTAGTFTAIAGGTTLAGSTSADSYASAVTPIGFTFNFDGANYTQFSASSNGWIRLGATAASAFTTTPISTSGSGPAIVFYSRDAITSATGIKYLVTGSPGSQVLTIEYLGYRPQWNSATNTLDVQIKLFEGTNAVQIVYGTSARANAYSGQTGLVGTATTNFANRTTTTNWSASTAGTLNTNTMSWSAAVGPASGLTYSWNPPTCFSPTALTNAVTTTSATHSWSAPSAGTVPSGYEWAVTTSATPPASGTATAGLTASSPTLTPSTTYYLHVRSDCGGGTFSAWATSSFFTGYCLASSTGQLSWLSAFSTTGGSVNIAHTAGAGAAGGYIDLTSTVQVSNYVGNSTAVSLTAGGPTVGFAI